MHNMGLSLILHCHKHGTDSKCGSENVKILSNFDLFTLQYFRVKFGQHKMSRINSTKHFPFIKALLGFSPIHNRNPKFKGLKNLFLCRIPLDPLWIHPPSFCLFKYEIRSDAILVCFPK